MTGSMNMTSGLFTQYVKKYYTNEHVLDVGFIYEAICNLQIIKIESGSVRYQSLKELALAGQT